MRKFVCLGLVFVLGLTTSCELLGGLLGLGTGTGTSTGSGNLNELGGTVSTNITLKKGITYHVTSILYMDGTLTIEGGAIVKFDKEVYISVRDNGSIKANGTSSDMIYFTAVGDNSVGNSLSTATPTKAYWGGIYVNNNSTGNNFNYCVFNYAGGDSDSWAALQLGYHTTPVVGCVFKNDSPWGLDASKMIEDFTFTGNTFENCDKPLAFSGALNLKKENGNVYKNNAQNGLFFYDSAGFADSSKTVTITWSDTNASIVIDSDTVVQENSTLKIYDNVIVKFLANASISFYSGNANLKVASSAKFTSFKNDSIGGDVNGDGSTSSPSMCNWEGMWDRSINAYVVNSQITYYDDSTSSTYTNISFTAP